MNGKVYEYEALVCEADGKGGAYVSFPYDIREWLVVAPVQREHGQLGQGIKGFASFVKSHIINVMHICDIHVLQRCY